MCSYICCWYHLITVVAIQSTVHAGLLLLGMQRFVLTFFVTLHTHTGEPNLIKPLDLAGARKLQLSTEKYLEDCSSNVETTRRRFYSVHETGMTAAGEPSPHPKPHHHTTVGLEQLVGAEHMDADGQVHLSKKASFKNDTKSPKKAARSDFKDAK